MDESKFKELLLTGKELAESNLITSMLGGKRLCDIFKGDLADILREKSQKQTLILGIVLDTAMVYNVDMWIEFERKSPIFFEDNYRAMILFEVLTAIKKLKLNDFNFEERFEQIYLMSLENYSYYKSKKRF